MQNWKLVIAVFGNADQTIRLTEMINFAGTLAFDLIIFGSCMDFVDSLTMQRSGPWDLARSASMCIYSTVILMPKMNFLSTTCNTAILLLEF
jgi:hypothetical protein